MSEAYLLRRRLRGRCLGGTVNLPAGTALERRGQVLYCRELPVCFAMSQQARDYCAYHGDGLGAARGRLLEKLRRLSRRRGAAALFCCKAARLYLCPAPVGGWRWDAAILRAPLSDLEEIIACLGRAPAGRV